MFIFIYLTSGYDKKISESKLSKRQRKHKVLSKIGLKKNIYFLVTTSNKY